MQKQLARLVFTGLLPAFLGGCISSTGSALLLWEVTGRPLAKATISQLINQRSAECAMAQTHCLPRND